jgi:hypothetical protein
MFLLLTVAQAALPAADPATDLFNCIEEGPWQIFECVDASGACQAGHLLGEAWATDAGVGSSWTEYGERAADWSFVSATTSWYVTVPSPTGSLTCGSPNCQKVGVATAGTFRPQATYTQAPSSGTQSYLEWQPVGKYEVTAFINTGSGVTRTAWYYVADGGNDTRLERICASSGFKWPDHGDATNPMVTWRIKQVSAGTAMEACPAFWKKWEFTIDLTP